VSRECGRSGKESCLWKVIFYRWIMIFPMGFISIRVAIFYAGSPNLPQPSFTRAWDRLCWDDSRKSSSQHRRSSIEQRFARQCYTVLNIGLQKGDMSSNWV
jgi:hypothetical protein